MENKVVRDANYYINLIMSNLPMIGAISGVCAVVAVIFLIVSPRKYESSVTILIRPVLVKESALGSPQDTRQPPKPALAEMMPRTLPVETYRNIAQSWALIKQVMDEMNIEDVTIESFTRDLRVELIPLGQRSPTRGTVYSGAMLFYARAKDPDLAAQVAQKWAELFKKQADALMRSGIEESSDLMDSMYTSSKEALEGSEDALETFNKEWNLSLMLQQRISKEALLTKLEEELDNTEILIAESEAQLAALGQELAEEDRIDTLFKAPSVDAYWLARKLQPPESGVSAITPEDGLRSEEYNPNYTTTRDAEVLTKKTFDGLQKKRDQTVAKIDELSTEIEKLQFDLAVQEKIQKRLTRDMTTFQETYLLVASKKEKSKIAKIEKDKASDILIAANAVVPELSVGPRRLVKVFISTLVGAILSVGYIIARDYFSNIISSEPQSQLSQV